ncbi:MAG: hypothetical protein IJ757_09505 [Clostridiales bacterium]|nr:hypothetical protein [Clostridiales bacterium]
MGVKVRRTTSSNNSKQLLLVLLFILACLLLSRAITAANLRVDSHLPYEDEAFIVPLTRAESSESVYIGSNLIFVPNVDYTDIEAGSFVYDDYSRLPHASGVTISITDGWSDLGPDAIWHNSDGMPQARIIPRDGKKKVCGVYLMTLKFQDPDTTYHINIPHSNGLVYIYCNGNRLGSPWGRTDEWTPSHGFGYGFVPIIPDDNGEARIMIAISTNEKIHNPGILSYPAVSLSSNAMKYAVAPSIWIAFQMLLYLFILIGGFLISRTFKNSRFFYRFIIIEFLVLAYTVVDCYFIIFDSYTKQIIKFVMFILINMVTYLFIYTFFTASNGKKKTAFSMLSPSIVVLSAAVLIIATVLTTPELTTWFPLGPELLFTIIVGVTFSINLIMCHFDDGLYFLTSVIEICQLFFCFNALSDVKGVYNIPAYSVFFVIANLTLEFYFTTRYMIQARTLEDTMEHMQFLVQEKTLRISEINKDLFNTNKKLMENEQARKNVLSNVSHDLRTPITAIRGYAEIMLSSNNLSDVQRQNYLQNIIRRASQMERIISDIVELTRLESNANEFQFTDISLAELLDELCMMYDADLQGTSKSLILDIPDDDLLMVKADPKKLSRVFENLISNAINYTYDEAVITVKAWREGAHKDITQQTINVDIKDNGIGIPENEIPMIFDRFYRAKNSGQNIKGTGIGLSIVKTIVDRHDATISVESAIGKGTTFHLTMKATYR